MSKKLTLAEYIEAMGVQETAALLGVSRTAVYNWLRYKDAPSPLRANELIVISGGLLTFESIYKPFCEKNTQYTFEGI